MGRITTQKEVTSNTTVTVGYECDICKKQHAGNSEPKDWHSFSSHHGNWGNESGESFEYFTVCSSECYFKQISICCVRLKSDKSTAKIDDMTYEFALKIQKQKSYSELLEAIEGMVELYDEVKIIDIKDEEKGFSLNTRIGKAKDAIKNAKSC